jgi:hypothetical protein
MQSEGFDSKRCEAVRAAFASLTVREAALVVGNMRHYAGPRVWDVMMDYWHRCSKCGAGSEVDVHRRCVGDQNLCDDCSDWCKVCLQYIPSDYTSVELHKQHGCPYTHCPKCKLNFHRLDDHPIGLCDG